MIADIQLPPLLKIGGGALKELSGVMSQLDVKRPCIIADPAMKALGVVDRVTEILGEQGILCQAFCDVMPEPDDGSVNTALAVVTEGQHDVLIALGGGSAIDSAKAIALLASHGGNMRDYKVPYVVTEASIPVVAIPTTAGTGSEMTKVTVISDQTSSEKMLCMGPGLMPRAAIVDYELTLTAPFRVTADTGIDALTHAIEAWVSKKANPFSDQQAISAMGLIAPNLVLACEQPQNKDAKAAMMLGASLAGVAFSNASVALVHGMSRPIGVNFHVPHGMSNAMLLPEVTRYSLDGAPSRYAECAIHMGLCDVDSSKSACHDALLQFLCDLNTRLQVPSMSGFGISENAYRELIPSMAEQAIASGSPNNNPKVPDKATLESLYHQLYQ